MKVAMFEGLKRAKHNRKACKDGYHASCVKNRTSKKGGQTRQQKIFAKAAKSCPFPKTGTWKQRLKKRGACISGKIKSLKRG